MRLCGMRHSRIPFFQIANCSRWKPAEPRLWLAWSIASEVWLAPGYAADLLVLRPHDANEGNDAYWSVVHSSSAEDVEMVLIGGKVVYGDAVLTGQIGGDVMDRVQAGLDSALREWGRRLAPLAECGQ